MPLNRAAKVALGLIAALLLIGCGEHRLRGVVIEGEHPRVELVEADDARLDQRVIPDARISLTLDPSSLNPKSLAELVSGPNGEFSTDLDAFGAGVLQYELGILCQREGFKSVYQTMPMPKGDRVMMIVLKAGHDIQRPTRDFLEETQRMGEQLLDP